MRFLSFVALLVACDPESGVGGGQTEPGPVTEPGIGAEPWALCVEVSREPVEDPTVAAEGFAVSPEAVRLANQGDWSGDWTQYGGEAGVLLTATVALEEAVTAVWLAPNEGTTGTGEIPLGAPESTGASCASYYEWVGELTLVSADGALAESFGIAVLATAEGDLSLGGTVGEAELQGTAEPSIEGEWRNVALTVWMQRVAGGDLEGSFQFSGEGPTNPDSGPDATSVAFAEPYGSFSLVRTAP